MHTGELVRLREIDNKQMTDRQAAARSDYDVGKDGAGDTDHPQMTSKAAAMVFRGMPSRSSRVGMSFAACHETYSNLDDIFLVLFAMSSVDTRLPRILIRELQVKFQDSFRSLLVNIPTPKLLSSHSRSKLLSVSRHLSVVRRRHS